MNHLTQRLFSLVCESFNASSMQKTLTLFHYKNSLSLPPLFFFLLCLDFAIFMENYTLQLIKHVLASSVELAKQQSTSQRKTGQVHV